MKLNPLPDLNWIKEHLTLDPESFSGLSWIKAPTGSVRVGSHAGSFNTGGYIQVRLKGKLYLAHRIVYYLQNEIDPGNHLIDHKESKDNNFEIRLASHSQNCAYAKKRSNCTSKYKGVMWDRNKWKARLRTQGKEFNLGRYENEEDAAKAYDIKALEVWGEFAFLNFPCSSTKP